jgi:hypothetical protein
MIVRVPISVQRHCRPPHQKVPPMVKSDRSMRLPPQPDRRFRLRGLHLLPQSLKKHIGRRAGARIIDRRLHRPAQGFLAQIGMRLEVALLAEQDEDRLARIGEHAAGDLVEDPVGQSRRQVGLEAQAAGTGLLLERRRLGCALFAAFLYLIKDIIIYRERGAGQRLAVQLVSSSDGRTGSVAHGLAPDERPGQDRHLL